VGESPFRRATDSASGGEGGPLVGGDWRRGLNVERGRMILVAVEVEGFERRAKGRVVRSVRDILGECC
jgi:hypothetical protein